jgi:hypothetical protein
MRMGRSAVHPGVATRRGENVWAILCRAALRGIEWAAEACGAKDAEVRVERSDLLIGYGFAYRPQAHCRVDWARLTDADRAAVARAIGAIGRRPQQLPRRPRQ